MTHFFLGGHDLEMLEIATLAQGAGCVVHDKGLHWGAGLSAYAEEITQCHAKGEKAVAVELINDMPQNWPPLTSLIDIDHHNNRSGGPSALEQVFTLLQLPEARWTRHLALVAVNDVAHIEGLRAAGANAAEISAIRASDRAAQGVSSEEERLALDALVKADVLQGLLTVVRLPHTRLAPVTDALALDPAFKQLPQDCLVFAPGEVGFFGRGAVVLALAERWPRGWYGGNLPRKGFWGLQDEIVTDAEVIDICLKCLPNTERTSKDRLKTGCK